jgi:ketosteroid isomerase-like protein
MVEQAVSRLNKGDVTAIDDFWAQDADYISVDGRLIAGRAQIKAFFQELAKSSDGSA